jgi:RNA binding exosome subunit
MVDLSIRGATVRSLLEHVWMSLPTFDRASILDALDEHLDSSGRLYLRLDKEEVFRGILRIKEQDPIKIQLSFQRRVKSDLEPNDEIKRLLESLERDEGPPHGPREDDKLDDIT